MTKVSALVPWGEETFVSVRHRQDGKIMTNNDQGHGPVDIEPRPFAWNNTRNIDHYSAYWIIRDLCDTVSNVSTLDCLNGIWDIKIGIMRNLDGPDLVVATCPLRNWAVWRLHDNGVAFLASTLDHFRCEPVPGQQWH